MACSHMMRQSHRSTVAELSVHVYYNHEGVIGQEQKVASVAWMVCAAVCEAGGECDCGWDLY